MTQQAVPKYVGCKEVSEEILRMSDKRIVAQIEFLCRLQSISSIADSNSAQNWFFGPIIFAHNFATILLHTCQEWDTKMG